MENSNPQSNAATDAVKNAINTMGSQPIDLTQISVQLWSQVRSTFPSANNALSTGTEFTIGPDFDWQLFLGQGDEIHCYLSISAEGHMYLVVISKESDQLVYQGMPLPGGSIYGTPLHEAPSVTIMKNDTIFNPISPKEANFRIQNWKDHYPNWLNDVLFQATCGDNNCGPAICFRVDASDILHWFEDGGSYVKVHFGLKAKTGLYYQENDIDLIFWSDESGQPFQPPDDFTTPCPPFGLASNYGLLNG